MGGPLYSAAERDFTFKSGGWSFRQLPLSSDTPHRDISQSSIYRGQPERPNETMWEVTTDMGICFEVKVALSWDDINRSHENASCLILAPSAKTS
ncbi:hypothetical protein Rhopal_002336-T1 [Rhodotorula paludigena]|uniref:Uncharacterized protein n=1 Tax=Rhodotorula paludigena TaxID=86838 RepID=A0AAV5G9S8_9BASI|nr:hypothetical protein Rhopal_002336-T1 [Rhodotorula paludigena]